MRSGPPRPWLLADIGGTNARFGWLAPGAGWATHVATLPCAAYSGPVAAARAYLAQLGQTLGSDDVQPVAAAFAVATAVGGERIVFTNSGWSFSPAATRAELGLQTLLFLNDFEALALSLPGLAAPQVQTVGPPSASPVTGTALAVIGPGTGLGVAGLVPTPRGWVAVPGEGGHASLSAADDFEAALLAAVRREHAHVSAERLLSGIGLPVLHRAVAAVLGQAGPVLAPEQIVERGLARSDEACTQTVDSFCALLGSFGRQRGTGARRARWCLHRRWHRAAAGRPFPRLALPRALRSQGPAAALSSGHSHLAHHRHAGRAGWRGPGAGTARALNAARRRPGPGDVQNGSNCRSNSLSASHRPASRAMATEPPLNTATR